MLRPVFAFLVLFCVGSPGFGEVAPTRPPSPIAIASDAMQAGRWELAAEIAARAGPVGAQLIEWHRLRAGLGTPDEVLAFLAAHGDWPGLDYLRKQSEEVFETASDAQVLAFYKTAPAQTGAGVLRHARALMAAGAKGDAEANLVRAWLTFDLSSVEHSGFVTAHGPLLAPHHAARLDMTLWRGLEDSALMMPLVSDARRAVAELRLMAAEGQRGLDAKIALLPEADRADPGLAHDRFNRYLKLDEPEKAIALMRAQSRIEGGLGEAWRWSGWRRTLARRMMREGDYAAAYDLAAHHQLNEGADFADLEWLAGYVALRFLEEPDLALDHFQRLRSVVGTPISLGRAGYWIGRAQEAMGDAEGAAVAYAQGGAHQTSFYGLLAAEKAGLPIEADLTGKEVFPDWRAAEFTRSSLYSAAILLLQGGQMNLAERFLEALAEQQDRTGLGQMAAMLGDLEQPHLQVMLGKHAAGRGIILPGAYYALHPMAKMDLPVPMEMALAIARRESEFDHLVASGAGAQGLMQLMPGTASDVARDLGLDNTPGRVLRDWEYNARLGSAYLAQMSRKFDGNVVMISAAYNAGPRRPEQWIESFGDPRKGDMDIVDWIEHIPFRETLNYVQRVAESLPVYRARLGRDPLPIPFSQELTGATIRLSAVSE